MADEKIPGPTATVRAVTYHTIDHDVVHVEGETYDVTDYELAMTLVGCGFVVIESVQTP